MLWFARRRDVRSSPARDNMERTSPGVSVFVNAPFVPSELVRFSPWTGQGLPA